MTDFNPGFLGAPTRTAGLLETMTIADLRDFHPEVLVIPTGSTEPHGPHLPYGTDTFIGGGVTAEAVRLANAEGARVLRLPPLPFGNNVNFKEFPFACRLRVETLMQILMDQVAFALEEGIRKVVIVNCHGGNDSTIKASQRQIFDRFGKEVFVCSCCTASFAGDLYGTLFKDGSPHAGDYETSMVQHLAPALVVEEARRPSPMNEPTLPSLAQGPHWVRPWHLLMPESCGGRPDHASAEKGKEFFECCVSGMASFLAELSREPWHPEFPYSKK